MAHRDEQQFLRGHSAHEPGELLERWRAVASAGDLSFEPFARAGEHELFALRSRAAHAGARRIYLSAGVHGDEPGAVLGLLHWAEEHISEMGRYDLLLFPLFNPWGIANNVRHDERGRELKRMFHSRAHPFPAWRRRLGRRCFDLALCLHEDFDARGCYIYELGSAGIAEDLLAVARPHIAPDPRLEIDDMEAKSGVIRRESLEREDFPLEGLPESVWLYFERCEVSLTLETPSEFSLFERVRAHSAMIHAALSTTG